MVIEKFKCKLTDASTIQERLFSASKAARKKRKQAAEDNACFVAKVTAVVESEGETAREDGMQDVDVADTTAAVVEGGGDVGDDGPNTDSSNVRECLRRERATMLMCSCLCLSCIFVSMSQDRAFVSVSAADSPSALSILLLQSSLSRLFILLPLFRRLHRLMYRMSGLRQMSRRQLTFLSGYGTSWQTMTPLP